MRVEGGVSVAGERLLLDLLTPIVEVVVAETEALVIVQDRVRANRFVDGHRPIHRINWRLQELYLRGRDISLLCPQKRLNITAHSLA